MHGYYVLPFLLGDTGRPRRPQERPAGGRAAGAGRARGTDAPDETAEQLAEALASMASWLGLDAGVEVTGAGDLGPRPAAAVAVAAA